MFFSEFGRYNESDGLDTLEGFVDYSKKKGFDTQKEYLASMEAVETVLERESGLVELPHPDVPTIIIPDLHARKEFLAQVLATKIGEETVFDRLVSNKVNIVCLGDAMHSEDPNRWTAESAPFRLNEVLLEVSKQDTRNYIVQFKRLLELELPGIPYEQMTEQNIRTAFMSPDVIKYFKTLRQLVEDDMLIQDTAQSLGMMRMIMDLKTLCPESFHFVRGNHDDVDGYVAKFNHESERTALAIADKFGEGFLRLLANFQAELPLVVKGKNFVASHAMPGRILTRDEIEERSKHATEALTATDNVSANVRKPSPECLLDTMANIGAGEGGKWIVGHRRVNGTDGYREQYDGKLVQICDPVNKIIAVVSPNKPFIPKEQVKILR